MKTMQTTLLRCSKASQIFSLFVFSLPKSNSRILLRLFRVNERGSTSPLSMRWTVRVLTSQYSASFSCVKPFCCLSSVILSPRSGWFMDFSFSEYAPIIGRGQKSQCHKHDIGTTFHFLKIKMPSLLHNGYAYP